MIQRLAKMKISYRKISFVLIFFSFFVQPILGQEMIRSTRAKFKQLENQSLIISVQKYLSRFVGKKANDENRLAAENFISSLKFVSKPTCLYVAESSGLSLLCQIISKYTIKNILFINMPASLLEEEIKRKLPIQEGTVISLDDEFESSLATVKSRVETFLKKNGYYGSVVSVSKQVNDSNSPFVEVTINIDNGLFARVNEVKVTGDSPIGHKYIKSKYQQMCLSFSRIIESISIGTSACYSRQLESETTQSLLDRFAELGYVQARIRVSHFWMDPRDPSTKKACRNISETDLTPRCVDLRIEIDKGPLVRWSINIKDRPTIVRNSFSRILGSIFVIDQLSRLSLPNDSDETAIDHLIEKNELAQKITFISAKNVDEQEISRSAEGIKEYLREKGYPNAEVSTSFTQTDSIISVNFDVYAGSAYFINSIKILPEKYLKYISQDAIENIINKRSMGSAGVIRNEELIEAQDKIVSIMKNHGFDQTIVKSDFEARADGGVDIYFYLFPSQRKIIDEIVIKNGDDSINRSAILWLSNCDNYSNVKGDKKTCGGSSFIAEELESDSKKLEEEYKSHNFLYARVKSEVVKDLNYKIIFTVYDSRDENNHSLIRQKISDIIISGNSSTNSNVIRRLFPNQDNMSLLDPLSLKKGLSNLRESRRFLPDISSTIIAGQEGSDDLYFAVHLSERKSLSLDSSISFSTDQYFMLETELEESNLFSSMLRLNTSLGLGLFWGRKSVLSNKLIWPFILGKNFQLTVNAPRILFEDLTHRQNPSRRLQSKVSFELEWRVSTRVKPYLKYSLIADQEDKNPIVLKGGSDRISSLDGLIPTIKQPAELRAVLTPGISFADLDSLFEPRKGVDINLWSEISVGRFMGKVPFVNVGIQNRFFYPIGPLTIALQASFIRSFIEPSGTNWSKLRNGSFAIDQLGGDRSVRGYREGSIGILALEGTKSAFAGYFINTANIELRFPIAYDDSIGHLAGALFVDQGMLIPCSSLFNCMKNKSLETIIREDGFGLSIGAALRYSLPVGPISLDYGISPLTGKSRWHILLGYSF